jgi:hypothetical protein
MNPHTEHMLEVRHALEHKILDRMAQEPAFRQVMFENPRRGLEMLGGTIPPDFRIFPVEEVAGTLTIVLPDEPAEAGT